MARHLMAVCVVCILCAEHVPCKEHFESLATKNRLDKTTTVVVGNNENNYEKYIFRLKSTTAFHNNNNEKKENFASTLTTTAAAATNNNDDTAFRIDYLQYNKRKGRTKLHHNHLDLPSEKQNEIDHERKKRHTTVNTAGVATHSSNDDLMQLHEHNHHYYQGTTTTATTKEFLKKLFQQFGNNDGLTMNIAGFETMLRRLGLYNLIEEKIPKEEQGNLLKHNRFQQQQPPSSFSSSSKSSSSSNESSCISSLELISRILPNKQQQQKHDHKHNQTSYNDVDNQGRKSLDEQKQLKDGGVGDTSKHTHKSHNVDDTNHGRTADVLLNSWDLYSICPILLYQLTAPTSLERSGCINSSLIPLNEMYLSEEEPKEDRFYVWVYATASVLGVSSVGLLGVVVIPCMDRHIYQHIIQFLVALAIGTLAGDALLHLLPHAMMTFSSQENSHESMVWKGLVAVLGVIFFFATERGLTMIAEWRKKIEKKEKPSSRVRVMRDPDSTSINNSTAAGDKLCKHKYSSYPYCYDEIAMDTKDDHHHYHHHGDTAQQRNNSVEKATTTPQLSQKNNIHGTYRDSHDHGDTNETAQSLLPHNNYSTISDSYSAMNKEDCNNHPVDNNTISTNLDDNSIEGVGITKNKPPLVKDETFTIILREHESSHHGHSHKHGHVHSPPRTLSAVAWMVVMGDGLHNFTDGMAIGAAFSNDIAGGFSTAIAVFCHELPHELGDFAVLLKAGMSAKQAVYYNLLSSVLSFMGMILGICIGDTQEASAWIFAIAAGMFIYIALVDMMPELTSTHNERSALSQCLIQIFGMSAGLGIMLLIALYEHDLKNIFSSTSSSHPHHDHGDHHNLY